MPRMSWDELMASMSDDTRLLNQEMLAREKGSKQAAAPAPAPVPTSGQPNKLKIRFEQTWERLKGPPLTQEYRFHKTRRWRADYVHLPTRTMIELEGGIFTGGRHTRGKGYKADAEKYRAAEMEGWRVLRLTTGFSWEDVERLVEYINLVQTQENPLP